jgi:hypothetical protein
MRHHTLTLAICYNTWIKVAEIKCYLKHTILWSILYNKCQHSGRKKNIFQLLQNQATNSSSKCPKRTPHLFAGPAPCTSKRCARSAACFPHASRSPYTRSTRRSLFDLSTHLSPRTPSLTSPSPSLAEPPQPAKKV